MRVWVNIIVSLPESCGRISDGWLISLFKNFETSTALSKKKGVFFQLSLLVVMSFRVLQFFCILASFIFFFNSLSFSHRCVLFVIDGHDVIL